MWGIHAWCIRLFLALSSYYNVEYSEHALCQNLVKAQDRKMSCPVLAAHLLQSLLQLELPLISTPWQFRMGGRNDVRD